MLKNHQLLLGFGLLCLLLSIVFYFTGPAEWVGPMAIAFFLSLALSSSGIPAIKGFSFALWIFSSVTAAMFYPGFFQQWGSVELKIFIVPLLQLIMFGMGTAMSLKDFGEVVKKPKAVLIGLVCQFTIMPLVGISVATVFGFPPEIAAGVVLIGSSPSGLASNVMTYIAKANLALSVTLTTVATLLAPLLTPALMKLLAGQMIPIDVGSMMWGITQIVILPIIAGLIFNKILHGKTKWLDDAMPKLSMICIAIVISIITASGRDSLLEIGIALIFASLIHNCTGYFLGYWSCRLLKMDERSCRTIALEVGLQNGGLASGIALQMGKVATVGLAPAVFGPMMNITGSTLASWWRDQPLRDEPQPVEEANDDE